MMTATEQPHKNKQWTRSEVIALAVQKCAKCLGLGLVQSRGEKSRPCECVLRRIFRVCFARFERLAGGDNLYIARLDVEHNRGARGRARYSRPNSEFLADFVLSAQRTLGAGTLSHEVFRLHYLQGADWKVCCARLGLSRGNFFHECYRIEARLGRAFREIEPYALFPLDEYFGGTIRRAARPLSAVHPILRIDVDAPARAPELLRYPLAVAA
jgi:hypothetical protein